MACNESDSLLDDNTLFFSPTPNANNCDDVPSIIVKPLSLDEATFCSETADETATFAQGIINDLWKAKKDRGTKHREVLQRMDENTLFLGEKLDDVNHKISGMKDTLKNIEAAVDVKKFNVMKKKLDAANKEIQRLRNDNRSLNIQFANAKKEALLANANLKKLKGVVKPRWENPC